MRYNKALIRSAVVLAAFAGAPAQAAGPTLSEVLGNSGITTSAVVDASYDWSSNDSVASRAFDIENDGFVLHQVNLGVGKTFDHGIGVNINAIAGEDANVISGDGETDDFDLTQANITKSWGNLSLMGGRYVTLAGMEVINPAGNLNASRSLLFFNQPLVHTGLRATYKVNDLLALTLGTANSQFGGTRAVGSALFPLAAVDNNTDQTIEAQIALTPAKNASAFLTYYTGNEDPEDFLSVGDADLKFDTVDLVLNYSLNDALYLGLNADYFALEDGAGGHIEAHGVAGYVGFKFAPKWRVALRSEYLNSDGDLAGAADDVYVRENTLTLAHACSDNLELLVEGRHDRASGDVAANTAFDNINGPIGSGDEDQYTGTFKAILKF